MYITFFAKKNILLYNLFMIRRSILAGSWYPDDPLEINTILSDWARDIIPEEECLAAIVPHAGWFYSGKTAALALKTICSDIDLLIVIGGHLPPGSGVLAAFEEEIDTPLGGIRNRMDLIERLAERISINEDRYNDNTVEVVLPMLKTYFPNAEMIWLRAPADKMAIQLGEEIFRVATEEGVRIGVAGSTDLTHYGLNYGYSPAGTGNNAYQWAKDTNDSEIIRHITGFRYEEALKHAEEKKSACSIGAAIAAARYAELQGAVNGRLLRYSNSYEKSPSDSFVGYAGIVF